jgi:hypothetical protein
MTRPLDPFDFDIEDDEDAATVLMSGHQRHLLREALRTPAPLEATVLDQEESEVAPVVVDAPAVEDERDGSWWVVAICMVVLAVAVGPSSYSILVVRQ